MQARLLRPVPMTSTAPYFREAGAGPGVVCIHANASSSSQWRALMERLAPGCHVLAADSHGAGKGPPWPAGRRLTLHDEAALLEPVLARAGTPLALVGHSYGAAVALLAALREPRRVDALVLYEPTLFSLLAAGDSADAAAGIRHTVAAAVAALARGDPGAAAEHFIDYWMGAGAWAAMPQPRRAPIEASIVNVAGWAGALMDEATPLSAFQALQMPVLLMVGAQSPASSRSVARLLAGALPKVEVLDLEGLGHMGPVTHPERVNELIADFLGRRGA